MAAVLQEMLPFGEYFCCLKAAERVSREQSADALLARAKSHLLHRASGQS